MNIKEFIKTRSFKTWTVFLGIILFTLVIFQLGVVAGFHKAENALRWENNYHRIFNKNSKMGMMNKLRGVEFSNPDGSVGRLIKIDLPNLFISDREGVEKEVFVSSTTIIRKFRDDITVNDLNIDDFLIVIGKSGADGVINAKLIRTTPNDLEKYFGNGQIMKK